MHYSFDLARNSFDTSERGLRVLPTIVRNLVVAGSVFVLVWLLKPDLFGLVPNSLDPMFYTGYAINLDDVLAAAGNRHYFVTRWTSYMPMYVFSEIFGPYWGRLVLRLVMILVLSELLWRFGHRLELPARSRLFGIFTVISAPLFVRAFTTDYPEYFIIWGSTLLILLALNFAYQPGTARALLIGGLSASLVISNPAVVFVTSITLLAGLWFCKMNGWRLRKLVLSTFQVLAAGIGTVVFGYLLFKFVYDIGNVYQPTLDFISTYKKPLQDGWVSPSNAWVSYFSWIFLPPLLASVGLFLYRQRTEKQKTVTAVAVIGILTYCYHVLLEARSGHALETSFYWSMSLGPSLILLYLIIGRLESLTKPRVAVIGAAVFLALVILRIPQKMQLPTGAPLVGVLIALFLLVALTARHFPWLSTLLFTVTVLWAQIGSATYDIRTFGGDLNSPRYDLVYRDVNNQSRFVQQETLWFLRQMDKIENDYQSTFLTAEGWSAAIVGTYIPHPFGKWIVPVSDSQLFSLNVESEFKVGYRPLLIIYGSPDQVEDLFGRAQTVLTNTQILRDVTNSGGLGYRLLIMKHSGTAPASFAYRMTQLNRNIGTELGNGSVLVEPGTSSGFASFGPYLGLAPGEYRATLMFSSPSSEFLGTFETFNDARSESNSVPISNSEGGENSVEVKFTVNKEDSTWQFRTIYESNLEVEFKEVKVEKIK